MFRLRLIYVAGRGLPPKKRVLHIGEGRTIMYPLRPDTDRTYRQLENNSFENPFFLLCCFDVFLCFFDVFCVVLMFFGVFWCFLCFLVFFGVFWRFLAFLILFLDSSCFSPSDELIFVENY